MTGAGWGRGLFVILLLGAVSLPVMAGTQTGFDGTISAGGINFDAKIRRNSTDPADLFHAHIGGMDTFARALITADNILNKSDYKKIRKERA